MSKERGTFLVEFTDGGKVLFGNNYKSWWMHAREYIYYNKGDRQRIAANGWRYEYVSNVVKSVSYSNQPFYDDGGLKWCSLGAYQEVIDEVCARDKLAPVEMADVVFTDAPRSKAVLTKKLKEY